MNLFFNQLIQPLLVLQKKLKERGDFMPSYKLTKKQRDILVAINTYVEDHGYAPSIRDIGAIVNLTSSSTVQGYLERLKEKGYITWLPGQPRTLRIIKTAS